LRLGLARLEEVEIIFEVHHLSIRSGTSAPCRSEGERETDLCDALSSICGRRPLERRAPRVRRTEILQNLTASPARQWAMGWASTAARDGCQAEGLDHCSARAASPGTPFEGADDAKWSKRFTTSHLRLPAAQTGRRRR
jgi:hypothetical protein